VSKIINYLKLTRFQNNFITFVSVILGGLSGEVISWPRLLIAAFSASFISAGGYALNDYFDIEIDRINRPKRILPQGDILPRQAFYFALSLSIIGIILSFFLTPVSVAIAIFATIFLYIYSTKFKRELLIGNITISLICALAFIYGGILSYNPEISLIPAMLAFLFHMGRELLKDMEDVIGDKVLKLETFAIAFGIRTSQFLISVIFITLIILSVFPYKLKIFSIYYFVLVLIMDFILFYAVLSLWNDPTKPNLSALSRILKFDMLLGILAIFAGKFG